MAANINAAKAYIDRGPPWIGDSDFEARDIVKSAGGKWHAVAKKWKAIDLRGLVALINTGSWLPHNMSPRVAICIVEVVKQRDRDEEAKAERARKEAELSKAASKDAFVKSTARNELMIPPNEQPLLDVAYSHGVTDATIDESGTWGYLGPRSGISDIKRLHRGVYLNIVTWEDICSGAAAIRNASSYVSNTRTGEKQARKTGVKRGGQNVRDDTGHTSSGKRKSGLGADVQAPASICSDGGGGTRSTER